jgi:hypothetical protein
MGFAREWRERRKILDGKSKRPTPRRANELVKFSQQQQQPQKEI